MENIFTEKEFNLFNIKGLDTQMALIRSEIQPLFRYYGHFISEHIQTKLNSTESLPVHVAKHIQRSVHELESTWCAIGGDNRGYKKYPHFQIGIKGEYLFIMLSFIDNILYQKDIAKLFQDDIEVFQSLPEDIMIIPNHTKLAYETIQEADLAKLFERLEIVKSAEFMIGRIEPKMNHQLQSEEDYKVWLAKTVDELLPMYQKAMKFYE
ncbi:MAG TPA: DUF1054 domain-containing protein [Aerococcaceae bacterium]|nr:DUF1054 domain-containing protein [Aerococcaceae bacterium]